MSDMSIGTDHTAERVCVPHEYVPANLGHSQVVCKWCHGTPAENAVLGPNHCESRPEPQEPAAEQGEVTQAVTADELEVTGKAPWFGKQPIEDYAKDWKGRPWVPLEAAIAELQFWQRRDYEHGLALPIQPAPPPAEQASEQEAVAYLMHWWDGDAPRCRVSLSNICEPWLHALKPTITSLYAHPSPDAVPALREALKPFADCCDQIADDESDEEWAKFRLLVKDYRSARAALKAGDAE